MTFKLYLKLRKNLCEFLNKYYENDMIQQHNIKISFNIQVDNIYIKIKI